MGAWGRSLSEQRIGDLVAYLRSLATRNTKGAAIVNPVLDVDFKSGQTGTQSADKMLALAPRAN